MADVLECKQRGPPQDLDSTDAASAKKRPRPESTTSPLRRMEVPTLRHEPTTGLIRHSPFRRAYEKYQVVYMPQVLQGFGSVAQNSNSRDNCLSWPDLADLFDSLSAEDRKTWTIENAGANDDGQESNGEKKDDEEDKPGVFLRRRSAGGPTGARRGYCSFLVQNDLDRMKETLARLPLKILPIAAQGDTSENLENDGMPTDFPHQGEKTASSTQTMNMRHGPCLWFFFGRNGSGTEGNKSMSLAKPLEGRPEHTDSVSHDGTWHYQLSGMKEWHLRPTAELLRRMTDGNGGDGPFSGNGVVVRCREGDALLINTRLWWHKTVIPPQESGSFGKAGNASVDSEPVPSVSYARDLYFLPPSSRSSTDKEEDNPTCCQPFEGGMTNVDGLYAADDIEVGTIVFTEHDMPDCELHRSGTNPNCELVELEDGTGAIVSRRDIKAGEFFCIAESSEDEEESEADGAEVDEGEEGSRH